MAASSTPTAPTPGWARATGSWSRPTRATAASCACRRPSPSSPTSTPSTWTITAASTRCATPSTTSSSACRSTASPRSASTIPRSRRSTAGSPTGGSSPTASARRPTSARCQPQAEADGEVFDVVAPRQERRGRATAGAGAALAAGPAQCPERAGRHRGRARARHRRRGGAPQAWRASTASSAASPAPAPSTASASSTTTATIRSRSAPCCATARARAAGRVIAVVQPHRYTRLRNLFDEFCTCFHDADIVLVAPVYAAGEPPIEGVRPGRAGRRASARHGHRDVRPIDGPDDLAPLIARLARARRSRRLPRRRQHHASGPTRCPAGSPRLEKGSRRGMSGLASTRLPSVRGTLRRDVPLAPLTWLRVGGPAEVVFQPADAEDLAAVPAGPRRPDVPVLPMGVASNLLVRDGGIDGVVIRFGGPLARVEVEGDSVARRRRGARPAGGAGGAARRLGRARVPDRHPGHDRRRRAHERRRVRRRDQGSAAVGRGARPAGRAAPPDRAPIWGSPIAAAPCRRTGSSTRAAFRGEPGDPDGDRWPAWTRSGPSARRAQPLRVATGGSTFKNPPGHKAWQLIDAAGCRGLRLRCRHGLGEALQFPDQHRRRQRGRDRAAGRAGAAARARAQRRRARVGGRSGSGAPASLELAA